MPDPSLNWRTTAVYFKSGFGKRGAVVLHMVPEFRVFGHRDLNMDSNSPFGFSLQLQREIPSSQDGQWMK